MIISFIFINIKNFIECGEKEHYDVYNILNEGDINSFDKLSNNDSMMTPEADLNEYLEFLDKIKWPVKHENNDLAKNTNDLDDDVQTLNENLDEYSRFLDPIRCINKFDDDNNCDDIFIVRFNEYVKKIHHKINRYIKKEVSFSHHKAYVSRLNMIKDTIGMINEYEKDDEDVFTEEIDDDYKCILNNLKKKYENRLILDNETYDKFSKDLDRKIEKLQNHEKHKILRRNIACKLNIHLKEFMGMYKYIKIVPELLILGYASTQSGLKKVVIPFHLIALFLNQNNEKLNENRILAMFLLKKAFSYTTKCSLDLISIFQIQDSVSVENAKLFFFSSEFNCNQRGQIKTRMHYYDDLNRFFIEDDRIHYNIVLRLFLFQHFLYLKYKRANDSELEEYKFFVYSILEDKFGCFKNQFYQFLNIVKLN